MATRRLSLILFVVLSGWLPIDAQRVRGRYTDKAKRPALRAVYVSICESRSTYAYHSGMCRCTHGVSQVSEAQARNRGYVSCKICY